MPDYDKDQEMVEFLSNYYPHLNFHSCFTPTRELIKEEKQAIIKEAHSTHLGEKKTLEKAKTIGLWLRMDNEIKKYVQSCPICQLQKTTRIKNQVKSILPYIPLAANKKLALDIFGPIPETQKGNSYILSTQDRLTRYTVLVPLQNESTNSIIEALIVHYIYTFGAPKTILSDQGSNFLSELMTQFENEEIISKTRERIQVEMEKTKRRLDENITRKHPIYKAGDLVKTLNSTKQNKLELAWKGPFEVIDYIDNNNLRIRNKDKIIRIHIDQYVCRIFHILIQTITLLALAMISKANYTLNSLKGLFNYIVSIPIIEKEGQIQRIIPIPHPLQNVYFSIIPDHDYVIKYKDSCVPIDNGTVSNCIQISEYKICFRNQPSIKLLDSENCEETSFKRYVDNKCKKSPFLLYRETFVPITNGYIVISLKGFDLDLACENNIKQETIFEPSLLLGSKCKLYNNYDLLYLGNTIKYNTLRYFNVTYNIQYSASNLASLESRLIQLPKLIDNIELQQSRLF